MKKPNPQQIQDVLKRGVITTISEDQVQTILLAQTPLRIKHGMDPSSTQMHLGYAVIYRKLRALQELGHTVVFLIGDFTARFGDPTGKGETRLMRDEAEVTKLTGTYIEQISKILDPARLEIRYNSEWYHSLTIEQLFLLLSKFTTAQMLERDMFQERMKHHKEIFLHELLYPVLQGYDSVMLKSDLTVIGSDQIFNEMIARDVQKIHRQTPQGIIALGLLPGTDGVRKMSQSYHNTIGLAEAPAMQYGKLMSMPDSNIIPYFRLLTNRPEQELREMEQKMNKGVLNPKDAKEVLAYEIVAWLSSDQEARTAQEEFRRVFAQKKIPTQAPEVILTKQELTLQELLVLGGIATSKSAARRLVEQKSVKIEGRLESDPFQKVAITKPFVVQAGKKAVKIIPR